MNDTTKKTLESIRSDILTVASESAQAAKVSAPEDTASYLKDVALALDNLRVVNGLMGQC